MRHRATSVCIAGVAAGVLWLGQGAPVAGAYTLIAEAPGATTVQAHGGLIVWNSRGADDRYRLIQRSPAGEVGALPIRAHSAPFDVDLGPDASGRTVAVYSRCSKESGATVARGCDLYLYDFATRRERRLDVGRGGVSETRPTIWKSRLVFTRVFEQRRGARGVYQYLYSYDLLTKRLRPLGQPPQGRTPVYGREAFPGPGTTGIDLRGDRLAYTWSYDVFRCGRFALDDGSRVGVPSVTELVTVTLRARLMPRVIERRCADGVYRTPASPTVTPAGVDYRRGDAESSIFVASFDARGMASKPRQFSRGP